MKTETLQKIYDLQNSGLIEFLDTEEGFAVNYDLTDAELLELVQLEYGSVVSSPEDLFKVMCKKLVKAALERKDEPV